MVSYLGERARFVSRRLVGGSERIFFLQWYKVEAGVETWYPRRFIAAYSKDIWFRRIEVITVYENRL